MIRLINLHKSFSLDGIHKTLIRDATLTIPSRVSVALLGRNGAGKSTLLKMISGHQAATSGRIEIEGSVSWPVGFAGSFHPDLSGAQNVRFVARIYGVDTDELLRYVIATSDLGPHFHLPVRTYSSGMRSRLAFSTSMGIAFDTYLVDEISAVGDASFRKISREIFVDRMRDAGAVVVSHSMNVVRQLCTQAIVLHAGELEYYTSLEDGIRRHEELLIGGPESPVSPRTYPRSRRPAKRSASPTPRITRTSSTENTSRTS